MASSTASTTAGVRNVVSGFFNSVVLSDRDHQDKPYLPEAIIPFDRLLEKHAESLNRLRLSEGQVRRVLDDPEQFRKVQQALRDQQCQTNFSAAALTQELVRKGHGELMRQEKARTRVAQKEAEADRQEQRKFRIRQELTEARIKARQALHLGDPKKEEESVLSDEDETGKEKAQGKAQEKARDEIQRSPDSVAAFLTLSPGQLPRYDLDLSASDDGDIQEIIDENTELQM